MNELAVPNTDPLQGNDWPGFVPSFSAMKILSLRDKDGKVRSQLDIDGGNHSLLWSLFGAGMILYECIFFMLEIKSLLSRIQYSL